MVVGRIIYAMRTKISLGWVNKVIEILLRAEARKTVKYVSPVLVVRAVRKTYGKKILKRHNTEIILTIGKPNFLEREFIKTAKKVGEKFPIKKIQIKYTK